MVDLKTPKGHFEINLPLDEFIPTEHCNEKSEFLETKYFFNLLLEEVPIIYNSLARSKCPFETNDCNIETYRNKLDNNFFI